MTRTDNGDIVVLSVIFSDFSEAFGYFWIGLDFWEAVHEERKRFKSNSEWQSAIGFHEVMGVSESIFWYRSLHKKIISMAEELGAPKKDILQIQRLYTVRKIR